MQEITTKFGALLRHAAETGFPEWQSGRNGLAAVLLMDQFTRHVHTCGHGRSILCTQNTQCTPQQLAVMRTQLCICTDIHIQDIVSLVLVMCQLITNAIVHAYNVSKAVCRLANVQECVPWISSDV